MSKKEKIENETVEEVETTTAEAEVEEKELTK